MELAKKMTPPRDTQAPEKLKEAREKAGVGVGDTRDESSRYNQETDTQKRENRRAIATVAANSGRIRFWGGRQYYARNTRRNPRLFDASSEQLVR